MSDQKMKSKDLWGSIIFAVLAIVGIVFSAINLFGEIDNLWVCDCANLVLLLLVVWYAFSGYKKPHGNLLKYVMLLRTLPILFSMYASVQLGSTADVIIHTVEIGMICFVAGRLYKIKQNVILVMIIAGIRAAALVSAIIAGEVSIAVVTPLIVWIDICTAYILRYKQHKEAGLQDA